MQILSRYPRAAQIMAYAIPVLPDVESIRIRSGFINPARSASRIIFLAGRSLTDPPGFSHSALALISTLGNCRVMRLKRSNDVPPISDKISWGPESTERLLVIVALAFGAISQIHSHYQRRSVNILRLLRACRVVTKRRAAPDESYCVGNCDRSGTLHIPLDRYPLADFPGCAGRPAAPC